MPYKRRISDRCLAKKLWDVLEPYLKTGGWTTIIGAMLTIAWAVFSFIQQGNASADTLEDYLVFKSSVQSDIAALKRGQDDMADEVHAIYLIVGNK